MTSLSAGIRIPVRRMDYQFPADMPRYWYRGNPWLTHFMNGLSAVFPDGERFFIQSVRNYQDRIDDPVLQKQIRNFIGQEANHGKEHEAFNTLLEERFGVPMSRIAAYTKRRLGKAQERVPKVRQLAMTAALEHFTAIMAHQLLENPDVMEGLEAAYGDMFMWHAVEETEHKAVAYDVYQQVSGDYAIRVQTMAVATVMFLAHQFAFMTWMVARDGKLGDIKGFIDLVKFLYVEPGPLRKMFGDYIDYYRRDFHPWMHDNRALITKRVEELKNKELRSAA
ncbi:MAG: metal-dependent hydrolase [Gammaproteobacteria bacterium]